MMVIMKSAVNLMLYYKSYLITVGIVILLILAGKWYIANMKAEEYRRGYAASDSAWIIKANENSAKMNNDYIERVVEEQKAREREAKLAAENKKLRESLQGDLQAYEKTPEASIKLGSQFIELYNKSLTGAK